MQGSNMKEKNDELKTNGMHSVICHRVGDYVNVNVLPAVM